MVNNKTIISNSCVGSIVYQKTNIPYLTPFVGSLFLNDFDYIKFLENYETYISVTPKIINNYDKNINFSKHYEIKHNYPLMILNDIEIHWIHETDSNIVIDNWNRRLSRVNNESKIFIWTSSEFMQIHNDIERKELIDRFCSLSEFTIFLTERKEEEFYSENFIIKYVENWNNMKQDDRFEWGFLKWNNQIIASNEILNILKTWKK